MAPTKVPRVNISGKAGEPSPHGESQASHGTDAYIAYIAQCRGLRLRPLSSFTSDFVGNCLCAVLKGWVPQPSTHMDGRLHLL